MFQIRRRNIPGNVKRAPAALFKRISTLVGHLTWKVLTELCRVPQTRRTNNVEIFQLSDRGITSPSIVATNDQPNLSLPPDVKNCKPEPEPHQHGSRLPELGTRNSVCLTGIPEVGTWRLIGQHKPRTPYSTFCKTS